MILPMILVISSKDVYAAKRLKQEALHRGILLEVANAANLAKNGFNADLTRYSCLYVRNPYDGNNPRLIPKVVDFAKKFKAAGKRVVDAVLAEGELGKGKWVDYQKLKKAGLPIPKTNFLFKGQPAAIGYPLIVKWIYGMKGRSTFLVKFEHDLSSVPAHIPKHELMAQEFIRADFEYKVITVGYKALPAVLRFKIKDSGFRVDLKTHGVLKSSAVPNIIELAQKASKTLKRELAKVDILEAGGKYYILEVNRFPGLESFEKSTKYNVAGAFLEYLQTGQN